MTLPTSAACISLCDALDRILTKGVVVYGDIAISVAGVDLLYIGLRGLICSIDSLGDMPASLRGPTVEQYADQLAASVEHGASQSPNQSPSPSAELQ